VLEFAALIQLAQPCDQITFAGRARPGQPHPTTPSTAPSPTSEDTTERA
jgi:hypothetical protein